MAVRPARRRLFYVFFTLILVALGLYLGRILQRPPSARYDALILVPSKRPLPPFEVRDFLGQPLNGARLQGHWTLVLLAPLGDRATQAALAFGNRVLNRLAAWPKVRAGLRVLYLGYVRGARASRESEGQEHPADTRAALRTLVLRTNPRMWAALADPPLRQALGAGTDDPPLFYLLDPQVRLRALFTPAGDPATLAADMERLLQAPSAP